MGTYSTNGTFRRDLRTPNTNIITDDAMLQSTIALYRLTSVPYHLRGSKLDKTLTYVRGIYNSVQFDQTPIY